MCRLIPSDRLDLGVRVLVKACILEVFDREFLECLSVECVFEVFEGKGIVENVTWFVLERRDSFNEKEQWKEVKMRTQEGDIQRNVPSEGPLARLVGAAVLIAASAAIENTVDFIEAFEVVQDRIRQIVMDQVSATLI